MIGQDGIRAEDRKEEAVSFASKMTDKGTSKPSAKATEKTDVKTKPLATKSDRPTPGQSPDPHDTLDNLVVVLEPNAARYELHAIDNRVLAGFLHNKFNVLLFNYIGFDSPSFVQPSLAVPSSGNQGLLQEPAQGRPVQVPCATAGHLRQESGRLLRC